MTESVQNRNDPWGRRAKIALIVFALIGGFFIVAEHRAHLWSWLPWLILAACPLMHLFMHHGHGGHGHDGGHDGGRDRSDESPDAPGPGAAATSGPVNTASDSTSHPHHGGRA